MACPESLLSAVFVFLVTAVVPTRVPGVSGSGPESGLHSQKPVERSRPTITFAVPETKKADAEIWAKLAELTLGTGA